jgi:hypothetical protein
MPPPSPLPSNVFSLRRCPIAVCCCSLLLDDVASNTRKGVYAIEPRIPALGATWSVLMAKVPTRKTPVLLNEALLAAVLDLTAPDGTDRPWTIVAPLPESIGERASLGDLFVWFDLSDSEDAREWLTAWLPRVRGLTTARNAERAAVSNELNRLLFREKINVLIGDGELELGVPHTLLAACALALMPFVLRDGWMPSRLGQCRYRRCGRWFLRPPPRRGTVAEYCSRTHATNERVARSRQKKAQRRREETSKLRRRRVR